MCRKSYIASLILHVFLFLLVAFGLPNIQHQSNMEHQVFTVSIVPVGAMTNIRPSVTPKPQIKRKAPKLSKTKAKKSLPAPAAKQTQKKPAPPPPPIATAPAVKPVETKKLAEPEPEHLAVQEEKIPEELSSFDAVLKSVETFEETLIEEENTEEEIIAKADPALYKPGLPISLSERDAIKQQIMQNWVVLAGGRDADRMVITLHITMNRDGSVADISHDHGLRAASDAAFSAALKSAIRAVHKSSPLQNLPEGKYDTKDGWRELVLRFDPSEMFY